MPTLFKYTNSSNQRPHSAAPSARSGNKQNWKKISLYNEPQTEQTAYADIQHSSEINNGKSPAVPRAHVVSKNIKKHSIKKSRQRKSSLLIFLQVTPGCIIIKG